MTKRTPIALLAATILAAGGTAGVAAGGAFGQDSSAVAVNTKDNSLVFKLTFAIDKVIGSSVTSQNLAEAYANCTSCRTVAISIQVLLVESDPTVFSPTNLAIAVNQDCTLCDTLATAYQFAIGGSSTKLNFTPQGHRDLATIRRQLEHLRTSGLSGPQIQQQVDGLMQQLSQVLTTEVVAKPAPPGQGPKAPDGPPPPGTPTTTTTAPTTDTTTTPTTTDTTPTTTDTTPTTTSTTPTTTDTTPTTTSTTPTTTDTTPTTTSTTPTTTTTTP